MFFEELPSLFPLSFFDVAYDAKHFDFLKKKDQKLNKNYLLPSFSKYLDEEEFAKIFLGWNEEGILIQIYVKTKDIIEVSLNDFRKKDSIELFFDTRNIKTQGYITKFCHHFVVFPKKIDSTYIREVTRFRNEDMHNLASPEDFEIEVQIDKNLYFADVFIPSKCLYGYDPKRFDRMGFTYRINRTNKDPQHFSVSSREYKNFERNPCFWSHINLIKT